MISISMEHANTIPYHMNIHYSGQTLYWAGSDKREVWLENMKDPKVAEHLKSHGWDHEYAIEYTYNSHGFRDDEFDERLNYIAVGCSFTEGIGLRKEQAWPSKLAKLLGLHVWNLGIGGASADTCFRILDHYINVLKPQAVFLLLPPPMRVELHIRDYVKSFLATDTNLSITLKEWFATEDNSIVNRRKNLLAMQQLCNNAGVKMYVKDSAVDMCYSGIRARDMLHHNEDAHNHIAKLFYEDFINGNR